MNNSGLEILLDNDGLFHSIFEIKPYEFQLGSSAKRKKQVDSVLYRSINPIINNCLRYALKHLDKYRHRAIEMLKFGIDYNKRIADEITFNDHYICNELVGGLANYRDEDYYNIVIFVDVEVNDDEIKSFIDQLPKFNKWR